MRDPYKSTNRRPMFASVSPLMNPCPDEFVLLALASGTLAPDELTSVDAHLDQCASCTQVIGSLGVDRQASGEKVRAQSPVSLQEGTTLGNYRLKKLLGEGAHGQVWLALDERLDREIAVKVLRPELHQNVLLRERTEREAKSLARLAHPNVVTVYSVEQVGDTLFLTMEYVRGKTLRQWLAQSPRPTEKQILQALLQAAKGLDAAHQSTLVHRDVKPDNIVVGDDGRTRITDFGLAKEPLTAEIVNAATSQSDEPLVSTALTQTGAMIGTPAYMALEQLNARPVDQRSDLFGFAVTAWEALYGARPFSAENLTELRARLIGPAPTTAKIADREFHRLLLKSLSSHPADRPASLTPLIAALERATAPRFQQATTALGASLVALAAVGVVGYTYSHRSQVIAPCSAQEAPVFSSDTSQRILWSVVSKAPSLTAALQQRLRTMTQFQTRLSAEKLGNCRATFIEHSQSTEALDARGSCLRRIEQSLSNTVALLQEADQSTAVRALVLIDELPNLDECSDASRLLPSHRVAPTAALRAQVTEAENEIAAIETKITAGHFADALQQSNALLTKVTAIQWAPLTAQAHRIHALALHRTGNFSEAATEARVSVVQGESNHDDRTVARAWLIYLGALGAAGRWQQTMDATDLAEAAIQRWQEPSMVGTLHLLKGLAQFNLGSLIAAQSTLESALSERERGSQPLGPVLSALGHVARARGEFERALTLHQRALAADQSRLGEEHPDVAEDHHNIGGDLRKMHRFSEAREHYMRALRVTTAALGAQSLQAGLSNNSLGLLALESDTPREAAERFASALVILEQAAPQEVSSVLGNSALAQIALQNLPEAVRFATAAVDRERTQPQPSELRQARLLKILGKAYVAQRNFALAVPVLRQAIALCARQENQHGDVGEIATDARTLLERAEGRSSDTTPPRMRTTDSSEENGRTISTLSVQTPPEPAPQPAQTVRPQPAMAERDAGAPPVERPMPMGSSSGGYLPAQQWRAE